MKSPPIPHYQKESVALPAFWVTGIAHCLHMAANVGPKSTIIRNYWRRNCAMNVNANCNICSNWAFWRFLGACSNCGKRRESEDDAVATFNKKIQVCNLVLITHLWCMLLVDGWFVKSPCFINVVSLTTRRNTFQIFEVCMRRWLLPASPVGLFWIASEVLRFLFFCGVATLVARHETLVRCCFRHAKNILDAGRN